MWKCLTVQEKCFAHGKMKAFWNKQIKNILSSIAYIGSPDMCLITTSVVIRFIFLSG